MSGADELTASVQAWIEDDPDARDRAELRELLDRAYPAGGGEAGGDGPGEDGARAKVNGHSSIIRSPKA